MAKKFSETSKVDTQIFNKGMVKDYTDIYIGDGMWTHAQNAINNAHTGESGTIGNEQSNIYCTESTYDIIGTVHKKDKEWVIFSTDGENSEIGLFNEIVCEYTVIVNDSCLNFSKENLITGVSKENYDCTWSVYWQDNRNPDRVMNLDEVPYICDPIWEEVEYDAIEYEIEPVSTTCGEVSESGGNGVDIKYYELGAGYGEVVLEFNAANIPDRFVVEWGGNVVIDTGYVGGSTFDGLFGQTVLTLNNHVHPAYPGDTGHDATSPEISGLYSNVYGCGTASFHKDGAESQVKVTVYSWSEVSGTGNTGWTYKLNCPVEVSGIIETPVIGTGIQYTDIDNNIQTVSMSSSETITICARPGTVINGSPESFTITELEPCDTFTVLEEVPCGVEECSEDLDCDALRLHPLVTQPCVSVKRAQGSGQLFNGSYMACIAYSENGIKLTDYTTPSVPQPLWDHTGIGGGIEILVDNLDQDYEEYELVVISVVNQQTVAKKIGYYSTDQTKISIDIINEDLETIPLFEIPIKSAVYEKSEKMFTINDYLIRTGVTTQPYFNYQPLANQIEVSWVAVEYPWEYYRDGGNNVSYMRDEIYPFLIRWVYKTGSVSNSFHIPGRVGTSAELAELPASDPNIYEPSKNKVWQIYDTSSDGGSLGSDPDNFDPEYNGKVVAAGKMAYWESTERYPNSQPDVWGDLCGEPIRHHKMPSNETIHIHNVSGDSGDIGKTIKVLGIKVDNIAHPVDENGEPIADIVGYEILRGSREGNRSIVAKGLFNNMREFKYDDGGGTFRKKGLFQNYPYNDLRTDHFLTFNPNYVDSGEQETNPNEQDAYSLTYYRKDYFSFHSPETMFIRPYVGSGNHVKIYNTELGDIRGKFYFPYKHPKHLLITDFAFLSAMGMGLGIGLVHAIGKSSTSGSFGIGVSLIINASITSQGGRGSGNSTLGSVADTISANASNIYGIAGLIGGTIGWLVKFMYYTGKGTSEVLDIYRAMMDDRQYALQYNSHGLYNSHEPVRRLPSTSNAYKPTYIRRLSNHGATYVGRGIQALDSNFRINNMYRNKYVCIKLDDGLEIPDPITTDDTRKRLRDHATSPSGNAYSIYKNPTNRTYKTQSSSHYGAIKLDFDNQYGQLHSIVQMPIGSCIYPTPPFLETGIQPLPVVGTRYSSDVLFGGDVYINRYTEKSPFLFFNTWLFDLPDGTSFDYREYINGPLPRYWANLEEFDFDDFGLEDRSQGSLSDPTEDYSGEDLEDEAEGQQDGLWNKLRFIRSQFGSDSWLQDTFRTPSDFHRLDRITGGYSLTGKNKVKNGYFYLFYNGIRDFFCESELNLAYRDYGDKDDEKFYDVYNNSFDDREYLFRSDKINKPSYYKYDLSLSASKLFNNFATWSTLLPRDYDPEKYSTCFEYYPNRAIYSLQQVEGLKRDNWKNFLALNYRDFKGRINNIKSLNATGAVILFEDAEPILFTGVDSIQTEGSIKLSVGDAGLFSDNNLQAMVNSDDILGYGTCISSRSAVNTPHGLFWISQDAGKIMHYSGQIDEISRYGMKFWFAENLPSWHRENMPEFSLYDNPIVGAACQTIYDPTYELVYFCKKEYVPITSEDLHFDAPDGIPYYICGEGEPPPLDPVDPIITETGQGSVEGVESCLVDIIFALDVSGSTFIKSDGGVGSIGNFSSTCAEAEVLLVMGILNDPVIQAGMEAGNIQVGFVAWATSGHRLTYNPVGITMSNLWTASTAYSWYVQSAVWPPSLGTNIPAALEYVQPVMDNKSSTHLGDRRGDPNFSQVIVFITDTMTAPAFPDGTFNPAVGCPYQSSDLGGGAEPYQKIITVHARPYDNDTAVTDALTQASISCNNSDLEFSIGADDPDSITTVANAIAAESCSSLDIGCNLTVSSTTVTEGETVVVTWNTQGAGEAVLNSILVPLNGVAYFTPTEAGTVIYELDILNSLGETSNCAVTVEVLPRENEELRCPCEFDDPNCFQPAHWTVSYDPKSKTWISFHDWIPDLVMPSNLHFNTIKGNQIWKHNDAYNSYANYYGVDYAWEVEYPIVTPQEVTTIRSMEYSLEVYEYSDNGKDFRHILDDNFDRAIIYNSEQISGLLELAIKGKNTPRANLNYNGYISDPLDPRYRILFSKEENKYRFNQFYDITDNRGEFAASDERMWLTAPNGVHKTINPNYVNYQKARTQHKKFRHYGNKLILRKLVSGTRKMILKVVNSKHLLSNK